MHKNVKTKKEVISVGGHLHEITTFHHKGKIINKIVAPLIVDFTPRDLLQVMLGATILAIPVGFTEETWRLGETLPIPNIVVILAVSVLFISTFVYYNYYRHHHHLRQHFGGYIKRVLSTYIVSLIVVAFLLTVIQITTWAGTEWIISLKKVVIVTLPASMSATVADFIK